MTEFMMTEKIKESMQKIKHKIIIISGKGGVGKSTVAVNLSYGLALQGRRVGLLDVDIHGPNIAKLMGLDDQAMTGKEGRIYPIVKDNIRVASMGALIKEQDLPIIWRGPLKIKVIEQFLGEIEWGELDYLIVDCPPGTGDEPLSVAQLIPDLDGSIVVTTPQDVALLDASKAINFSNTLNIRVIGLIENMSWFVCPYCKSNIPIFKAGGGEKIADRYKLELLGKIPFEPEIVELSDNGKPFVYFLKESESGRVMMEITKKIMEKIEQQKGG